MGEKMRFVKEVITELGFLFIGLGVLKYFPGQSYGWCIGLWTGVFIGLTPHILLTLEKGAKYAKEKEV